ncbi:hypothetical protein ACP4OV_020154 [Aristida adscensionis]
MAEAIFSAIVGDAVSRVISLIAGRFKDQPSTEAKLRRICHMLVKIQSVVDEAKARHITNHGTLQWLSELIYGEYEGRYLLDTIGCNEQISKLEGVELGDKVDLPRSSSLSQLNPAKRMRVATCAAVRRALLLRPDPGVEDVDRVLEILQGVSCDLKEFIMLLQTCQPVRRPLATRIFLDGHMFGRHVEKEKLINFLLHDAGELGVLPIIGDIGVGKTMLVQHACNDARVRGHFPVIMLFHFSSTYTMATSESALVLGSKLVTGDDGINLSDPVELIKRNVHGKRFLMVFEDVSVHKQQMLKELLPSLGSGKKGSRIVFTTNNRRVTSLGTVEPIILKTLPCPEYWFFFKMHAFAAGRDVEENPKLMAVGKAIATKLNGSFFGAKMVGEMLRNHPNPTFWCKVLQSNIENLSLLGDGVGYIADLTQNLLPDHVKMCQVTISKDPFTDQMEMASFQDLVNHHGSTVTCFAKDVGFARLLLCKSVLPFYNLYYTACCAIGSENAHDKRFLMIYEEAAFSPPRRLFLQKPTS